MTQICRRRDKKKTSAYIGCLRLRIYNAIAIPHFTWFHKASAQGFHRLIENGENLIAESDEHVTGHEVTFAWLGICALK